MKFFTVLGWVIGNVIAIPFILLPTLIGTLFGLLESLAGLGKWFFYIPLRYAEKRLKEKEIQKSDDEKNYVSLSGNVKSVSSTKQRNRKVN